MASSDLEAARQSLREGRPSTLIGLEEGAWLEVKDGVYRVDDPAGVDELVKDVAAFANGAAGGLLLIGFRTKKEGDRETVDQLRPVPRSQVDMDRHRELIRDRVVPPPRDLEVRWIDCGDEKGVLCIDVPCQPAANKPYAVPASGRGSADTRPAVAVPLRDGDSTRWLPRAEIQRLLAAGWAAKGAITEELVRRLFEESASVATARVTSQTVDVRVGQGQPEWAARLTEAWEALGGDGTVGVPRAEAYVVGPGVVQQFKGPAGVSWTMCAISGSKPIAVAGPVLDALQDAGSNAPGGQAFAAVGFPFLPSDSPAAERFIKTSAHRIELRGGSWGTGWLVRGEESGEWQWEPALSFSFDLTPAARDWSGDWPGPELRVRAIATLPWAIEEIEITAQTREALLDYLPQSRLAGVVTDLSARRGARLLATRWQRGEQRQSLDQATYACSIRSPSGEPGLEAEVFLALPGAMRPAARTCAEVRVVTFAAWFEAIRAAGASEITASTARLGVSDLYAILEPAWEMATGTLPAVVMPEPSTARPTGPPKVELRVSADRQEDGLDPRKELSEYIDLAAWGETDRASVPEMSITVTAPVGLGDDERTKLTRKALVRMANGFGFLDASERFLP